MKNMTAFGDAMEFAGARWSDGRRFRGTAAVRVTVDSKVEVQKSCPVELAYDQNFYAIDIDGIAKEHTEHAHFETKYGEMQFDEGSHIFSIFGTERTSKKRYIIEISDMKVASISG